MVCLIRVCVQIWDHLGKSKKKNGGRLGGHFPGWVAVNLSNGDIVKLRALPRGPLSEQELYEI